MIYLNGKKVEELTQSIGNTKMMHQYSNYYC